MVHIFVNLALESLMLPFEHKPSPQTWVLTKVCENLQQVHARIFSLFFFSLEIFHDSTWQKCTGSSNSMKIFFENISKESLFPQPAL